MDRHYKDQLPQQVAVLIDQIEAYARREIQIAVDTRPVSPTDPNPDRLAAEVTEQRATIYLRAPDAFPPHGVLHELLHIHRFWVDGIPQVLPVHDPDGERLQVTGSIENALEHQIIVPREAEYGFEPYSYWNETERRLWGQYPWPAITNQWARRKNSLLGWLTVSRLVSDDQVKAQAADCLKKEGLFDEAQRFATRIAGVIESKPRSISATLRFLKIPIQDVRLVRFNVLTEQRDFIPIPEH